MEPKLSTKTFAVTGMTCVNCESRIERRLKGLKGVAQAKVRYATGKAAVSFDESQIAFADLARAVESLGYQVPDKPVPAPQKALALRMLGVAAGLMVIYLLLQRVGALQVFNLFPQAKAGMGYGALFLIGLLTSLHCVAMCGGINLSQCVVQPHDMAAATVKQRSALRASLLYNAGRVASYTVIGGVVGALGSVVSFSGVARGWVQLLAGVFMVIMGLNLLGIFPWLRRLTPRMPRFFSEKAGRQSNRAFFVGLLNGLMPCGPLQAMQLYALSTGSAMKGALSMLMFSLGTVPLLMGLGVFSTLLSKKFTTQMTLVSAVLVVMLGVGMFQSGMSLSGVALPSLPEVAQTVQQTAVVENIQAITSEMSASGYEPITVKVGIPVRWTIQADEQALNGCNNAIIIPAYQIQKELQPGDNVIEFTPDKAGTIPFSCWMGMIRSKITVTE